MRKPTVRQLQVLERIARSMNFSQAGRELHLTQPTVSMQMRQLADTVGAPLFQHLGKRLFFTEAGEQVLAAARQILDALDQMDSRLAALGGLERGHLRLGVVTTAKFFAPRLMGEFQQLHPGIEASLTVARRDELLRRLRENLDDIYIFSIPPEGANLTVEPFLENELVVIAARQHPLAARKTAIPPAALCAYPFIQREAGSGTRTMTDRFFAKHGLTPRIQMELGSNFAIQQVVATGIGIAIVSRTAIDGLASGSDLALLNVKGFPLRGWWHLVYPTSKSASPVVRQFAEFVHSQHLLGSGTPPRTR